MGIKGSKEAERDRINKANDIQTQKAYEKVLDHFKGDKDSSNEWFYKKQKKLDGKSGLEMIGQNRADGLNDYIDTNLRGKK